jgi:hypothetical protein
MIGIPGIPIAAMLISSSLWRTNPAWAPHRSTILWPANATWISLVLMTAYLMWAVPRVGGFNGEVWAGWMNRLVAATHLAWQLAIAYRLMAKSKAPYPRSAHASGKAIVCLSMLIGLRAYHPP